MILRMMMMSLMTMPISEANDQTSMCILPDVPVIWRCALQHKHVKFDFGIERKEHFLLLL